MSDIQICEDCGNGVPPRSVGAGGKPKRFCSEICRRRASDKRCYRRHQPQRIAAKRAKYREDRA